MFVVVQVNPNNKITQNDTDIPSVLCVLNNCLICGKYEIVIKVPETQVKIFDKIIIFILYSSPF
uniref:Uncharacterized protein n=1 Tax=Siphoviridae sp. cteLh2 TaxID=2825590 RepID=A0A8S5U633_9CAUD|nr:MAG TPA: hypothetical protein [Siphoviridae sp. cteLh2]